jgi:hypothetical protein
MDCFLLRRHEFSDGFLQVTVRPQQAARPSRQPVLVSAVADSNRRQALAFAAGALLLGLTGVLF